MKQYTVEEIKEMQPVTNRLFSPNHILEVYLYEYYAQIDDITLLDEPVHKMLEAQAAEQRRQKKYVQAEELINLALDFNVADIELHELKYYILWEERKFDEMHDNAMDMYPYCFTRRDFASFYRILACYHLEVYEPERALMLYAFSNLYEKNREADSGIAYLEAATKKKLEAGISVQELSSYCSELGYPIQPAEDTLKILYQTAKHEKTVGHEEYAGQLYTFLNQLVKT